jgi:hypothetical protein
MSGRTEDAVTYDWARALNEVWEQLLLGFAVGTAVVCVLAAVVLLWPPRRRSPAAGAYYVGHRDASAATVYLVAYSHVARIELPDPAWGSGVNADPLAAAILSHHTGRPRPPAVQVGVLAAWLEDQADDGFVLERAELDRIVEAHAAAALRTH